MVVVLVQVLTAEVLSIPTIALHPSGNPGRSNPVLYAMHPILRNFKFEQQKLSVVYTPTLANTDIAPPLQPIFEENADPKMDLIKAFLSKILASPDVIEDPIFFKHDIGSSIIAELLQQTAVEIEEKKAEDKKIEEAVSAALRVETFSERNVLPSNYPFLADLQDSRGRRICLKLNKDIPKLLL